jgi:steroid delta-isomerase-like uncharacterized protein
MERHLKVISLGLLLATVVACHDTGAKAELDAFRAQAALERQNLDLIRQMFETLDRADWDGYKEFFAPEFSYYLPSDSASPVKVDEMIEGVKAYFSAFPDLVHRVVGLVATGDKVIVRFVAQGTHRGELDGLPPTGQRMVVSSIEIFTLREGKIIEERQEADMLGMMTQIGLELKPKGD